MKLVSILATFGAASLLVLSSANASDHDRAGNSEYHYSEQRDYDGRSDSASTGARNAASILGFALSQTHRGSYGYRSFSHHRNYGYDHSYRYQSRGYREQRGYNRRGYKSNRSYRGNRGYSGRSNRGYRGHSYRRGY